MTSGIITISKSAMEGMGDDSDHSPQSESEIEEDDEAQKSSTRIQKKRKSPSKKGATTVDSAINLVSMKDISGIVGITEHDKKKKKKKNRNGGDHVSWRGNWSYKQVLGVVPRTWVFSVGSITRLSVPWTT